MKSILNRLLDKWTGVFFYRLIQKWELNGYRLQAKDDYRDFITLHSNRLACALIAIYGGPIIDKLHSASKDMFKEHEAFEEILDQLVSASRSNRAITASFSRDREKLESFWLGVLTADLVPDLEERMGSGLREASIETIAFAVYLSEIYFGIYYELIVSKPDCRVLLCPENDAITDFAEARVFSSGDILESLEHLWDSGVNLGKKYKWQDAFANTIAEGKLPEGFHEAVIQLIDTTTDFVAKTEFLKILAIGAKGRLVSTLKKATWHDRQDEEKKKAAQKRQPREPDIYVSDLASRGGKTLSFDDALARHKSFVKQDLKIIQDDYRRKLYEMTELNQLTDREKQVLVLKIAGAGEGEIPTHKKVGEEMGISEARVSQLFSSARQKLRRLLSSMNS